MNVYLSGPITGREDTAAERFNTAKEELRALGARVFSPVETCPVGWTHEEAMLAGLNALTSNRRAPTPRGEMRRPVPQYDAVVALPGYESSEGCRLECAVARAVGIPVVELADALAGGMRPEAVPQGGAAPRCGARISD